MGLVEHAKKELELAGLFSKGSDYEGMLGRATLELVEVFAKQGHSGMSASIVTNLFNTLARFKPIVPLTLKDDEWTEVREGEFQNKRNSAVFKKGVDGRAYFIDAYYKKTQKGETYCGRLDLKDGSQVGLCYIKDTSNMPTICIDVIDEEIAPDDWKMTIKDESQIDELRKYYDFELIQGGCL